jgi:hypothetical protein
MENRKFAIGQLVKNFGDVCRVIGYKNDGEKEMLVVIGHGLQIGGQKWIADPNKCEPFEEYITETYHVPENALAFACN